MKMELLGTTKTQTTAQRTMCVVHMKDIEGVD